MPDQDPPEEVVSEVRARADAGRVVKGYEFEKGRWVVVDDEDIAKVNTESTKVINLVQFTDDDEIDPMYVDKAYTWRRKARWRPTPTQ